MTYSYPHDLPEYLDPNGTPTPPPPTPENGVDNQYERLLHKVLTSGTVKNDRTGTGTVSLFGETLRYNLAETFPLITTKRIHLKSVAIELFWFLRGETNTKWLTDRGVTIWDEWADENGDLGPVYGHQWRSWNAGNGETIDQIQQTIDTLRTNPDSRRILVSAWNVAELDQMALMPCHALFQFYVQNNHLSCQLYQRSADMFLGVPFNIASYALLTKLIAQQVGMKPGEFIWVGGDCHIYSNHYNQVQTQISRKPYSFPELLIKSQDNLLDYEYDDLDLRNYQHHPGIKAPIAI